MASTPIGTVHPRGFAGFESPLALGGALSAVGALSVVVTSAFYVASPQAVAGPVAPLDLAAAMAGAVKGAATLRLAGTVGVFGDLVWATAALLIALELGRSGRGVSAAGWVLLFLSIVIFTLVDGMTGYVFPPLAAASDASAFLGLKRLWDMLFLLGTAAYGAGVLAAMSGEAPAGAGAVDRFLVRALTVVGLFGGAAAVAGLLGVTGLPIDRIAGASIGLGSAMFVPISLKIAARRSALE
jgi:hypothetical protein